MDKLQEEEWREYKRQKLKRSKRYDDLSMIDSDFNVIEKKRIILDDELLKMIWLIRKHKPGFNSEKQVIKSALESYLHTSNSD